MSALPCGCDTESLWTCEEHRPKTGTVQQFKDRLEHADAMAGTSATDGSVNVIIESRLPSLAEQFRVEAVRIATQAPAGLKAEMLPQQMAYLTTNEGRDDLLNRIATLEADLGHERDRAVAWRTEALKFRDQLTQGTLTVTRIAVILTRFYTEPLSLSSVQPLIALALELNPDLVERAR